jgi:hypothetical protein
VIATGERRRRIWRRRIWRRKQQRRTGGRIGGKYILTKLWSIEDKKTITIER